MIVHRNPDIFPEPEIFSPERWLQSGSQNLDKYLVAFSRGPRSCLGIKYVRIRSLKPFSINALLIPVWLALRGVSCTSFLATFLEKSNWKWMML
jgi:hypothetical protein